MYSIRKFSAFSSHFQVSSGQMSSLPDHLGHLRSHNVNSCHVTASSCELQPRRNWNVPYTRAFGLLQPLPGDIQSNDVTFGSLPVTWGHVTFPVMWLPPSASYSLVGSEMYSMRVFCLVEPLPGVFRSNDLTYGSLPVTWGHVTSFPVTWLPPPASYNLEGSDRYHIREFSAFSSHFQVTSSQMTSLQGHFPWLEVTWRHFLSRDCLLRATAL